jgi:hypothetical protein
VAPLARRLFASFVKIVRPQGWGRDDRRWLNRQVGRARSKRGWGSGREEKGSYQTMLKVALKWHEQGGQRRTEPSSYEHLRVSAH